MNSMKMKQLQTLSTSSQRAKELRDKEKTRLYPKKRLTVKINPTW